MKMADNLKYYLLVSATLLFLVQGQKQSTCEVAKIPTQRHFNLSEFMGEWHVISDFKIFPHQHQLDNVVDAFTNIRVYAALKDSHRVQLTTVCRVLGVCVTRTMTAERPDFKTPAKLEVSSPDSWWSYLREAQPVWVIWTDGDAALLYSCGKELPDGKCDPHHTYSWTLNRQTEGHSNGQKFFIDGKINQLCLDPADFKQMKRSWPCAAFDTAALDEVEDDDDSEDDTQDPADDQANDPADEPEMGEEEDGAEGDDDEMTPEEEAEAEEALFGDPDEEEGTEDTGDEDYAADEEMDETAEGEDDELTPEEEAEAEDALFGEDGEDDEDEKSEL